MILRHFDKMKRYISALLLSVLSLSAFASSKGKPAAVEPFDRGITLGTSNCFIPKGTVGAGISVSYNNYSLGNAADDMGYNMLFSLIKGLHGNMMSFGVAPYVSYFLMDNLSLGLRFDYARTAIGLGNVNLSISEDLGFSLSDFHYLKQSYTGAVTLRDYIPFGSSKRFAMFAEIRATGGYGQSETYKLDEQDKFGTYQDIYKFEIGLIPGLAAFVTNELALEVSVGLLGFDYQKVVQVTNQVEKSEMEKSGANFKINLLAINFGMSFYIPTGAHRVKSKKAK